MIGIQIGLEKVRLRVLQEGSLVCDFSSIHSSYCEIIIFMCIERWFKLNELNILIPNSRSVKKNTSHCLNVGTKIFLKMKIFGLKLNLKSEIQGFTKLGDWFRYAFEFNCANIFWYNDSDHDPREKYWKTLDAILPLYDLILSTNFFLLFQNKLLSKFFSFKVCRWKYLIPK